MKLKLKVDSTKDVKQLRRNIAIVQLQLPQFQAITVRKLANQIFVDPIHNRMRANGISEKIINGTYLDNIEILSAKKVRLFFRSEYFSEAGFDVALAREKGTDIGSGGRHKVAPTKKKALKFIQVGNVKFSKGHEVDGLPALHTIENTIVDNIYAFQDSYNLEFFTWLQANLGDSIAI